MFIKWMIRLLAFFCPSRCLPEVPGNAASPPGHSFEIQLVLDRWRFPAKWSFLLRCTQTPVSDAICMCMFLDRMVLFPELFHCRWKLCRNDLDEFTLSRLKRSTQSRVLFNREWLRIVTKWRQIFHVFWVCHTRVCRLKVVFAVKSSESRQKRYSNSTEEYSRLFPSR